MSRSAADILEFPALLALVRGFTTCELGRRHVMALAFTRDRVALESDFTLIREAMAWLRAGREMGFGALADPEAWLARLAGPGSVLAPHELLDAAGLLETSAWLRAAFREEARDFPALAARAAQAGEFRSVVQQIRRAILPNGEIADDASAELRRIRGTIARARDEVQKKLKALLHARAIGEDESGEAYVTLRNDRFVIPVRSSDRRSVPGIVHGSSSSGQTVFVEPFETVEMNNHLVQLAEDEAAEIARILAELTDALRAIAVPLRAAADSIALFDSIFARARYAREFDCALPEFTAYRQILLDAARHPLLDFRLRKASNDGSGAKIVPMTLALGSAESGGGDTVLVISGPNTGGKTVALKTAGLAALAAQSGIPVPAQRAVLPLFNAVLADIGDEQSIAADLSTFSAHMTNLRAMLAAATPQSLVLADEMGTGTAPEEGAALAVALLEEFRARGCLTLATTHHDRLKIYASTTSGILNAAVEFDAVNLRPTYRLITGVPGVSSGIAIAERLGLPPRVVARAREEMSPAALEAGDLIAWLHRAREDFERLQREVNEERAVLQTERRALQTEWAERQRARLAELEKQFAATLKQYEAQVAALLGEIRDREVRGKLEKQASRGLAKAKSAAREDVDAAVVLHLSESQQDLGAAATPLAERAVTADELVAGARVRVRGFAQPVLLKQHDGRSAEIQAGPLRMKVRVADITAVVAEDEKGKLEIEKRPERGVSVKTEEVEPGAPREINVIGMTVEQSTERVDKFLDDAALAGLPRVRIIHGHGTGALRRGLAAFLAEHPHVARIESEAPERGGAAVTVVQLKG